MKFLKSNWSAASADDLAAAARLDAISRRFGAKPADGSNEVTPGKNESRSATDREEADPADEG